jgi:hypothetical protein
MPQLGRQLHAHFQRWMQVSGQFYASAVLTQVKEPPMPTAGLDVSEKEKNFLLSPGVESRFLWSSHRLVSIYQVRYLRVLPMVETQERHLSLAYHFHLLQVNMQTQQLIRGFRGKV